jgi:hypothetical protein
MGLGEFIFPVQFVRESGVQKLSGWWFWHLVESETDRALQKRTE